MRVGFDSFEPSSKGGTYPPSEPNPMDSIRSLPLNQDPIGFSPAKSELESVIDLAIRLAQYICKSYETVELRLTTE